MNIIFWALVIIGAVILWMALSPYFWSVGEFLSNLWGGAKEAMEETEYTEIEEEEEIE